MIIRRESLMQALGELESGTIEGSSTVIVSRRWWDALAPQDREAYRLRASRAGVALRADDVMSSHFVEVRGDDAGPPLSTERPM
jgi:hypothetical protein